MVKVQLQAARSVSTPSSTVTTTTTSAAGTSTSSANTKGPTATSIARTIVAREGIQGLYRGMSAPLIGVTPIFAVCFWAYDVGKQLIRSIRGYEKDYTLSLTEIGIAGAFSAIPTTAIMAPGERIKVLLQTSRTSGMNFQGPKDVVKHILKTGGIRSLFAGSTATLLRDGSGSFAYFAVYEGIKRYLTPTGSQSLSPTAVIIGGGFAGVCNWLVAIPFDTIKSRIQMATNQQQSTSVFTVGKTLIREEGTKALFKGIGPALLRAFPANAASFMGMELSRAFLDKYI